MENTPITDWTADDASSYASDCITDDLKTLGAPAWCKYMDSKDKSDWGIDGATDYATYCLGQ